MTLDARSIIAIISAAGLIGSGVLEGLGMASTPQWLIGTAAGWVTTFLGITIYQSKNAAALARQKAMSAIDKEVDHETS